MSPFYSIISSNFLHDSLHPLTQCRLVSAFSLPFQLMIDLHTLASHQRALLLELTALLPRRLLRQLLDCLVRTPVKQGSSLFNPCVSPDLRASPSAGVPVADSGLGQVLRGPDLGHKAHNHRQSSGFQANQEPNLVGLDEPLFGLDWAGRVHSSISVCALHVQVGLLGVAGLSGAGEGRQACEKLVEQTGES
ncbi:unnamed protein product [Protopolystoma xenopodis]|uniref:Uncharacterized protein n=1 Tax=Protopolystoma xenopodis TaxID=117903 RepID=A0A3S5AU70_9PLAT|nr:unnamed protein product [Protopolystoma xenopodis]